MARPRIHLLSLDLSVIDNNRRLQRQVGMLKGIYDIDLTPRAPRRSDAQNRFFHGVITTMVADAMREAGNDQADPDYAKAFLKHEFLKDPVINNRTGEQIGSIVLETRGLDTARMSRFIEDCIAYAADYWGIVVPDPSSYGIQAETAVSR